MAECLICKKGTGITGHRIAGGAAICSKCYNECGFSNDMIDSQITQQQCEYAYAQALKRRKLRDEFAPTRRVDGYLEVNENNETFVILGGLRTAETSIFQIYNNDRIAGPFKYENIDDIELCEDGTTKNKISMTKVLLASKYSNGIRDKGQCEYMYIKITLKDTYLSSIKIPFVRHTIPKSSDGYAMAKSSAGKCYDLLESMMKSGEQKKEKEMTAAQAQSTQASSTISQADELIKFKQLLDMGIITEEEFNVKKEEFKNTLDLSPKKEEAAAAPQPEVTPNFAPAESSVLTENVQTETVPTTNQPPAQLPLVQRTWFVILMYCLIWPVGVFLMYKYKKFSKRTRAVLLVIAIIFALLFFSGI